MKTLVQMPRERLGRFSMKLLGVAFLCATATRGRLDGQVTRSIPPAGAESHTVIPGEKYDVGAFKRWVLGSGYRDIWRLPLEAPVFDFDFAGGLTPFEEGGFGQTRSVKFLGADGRQYAVRSIDKDPTRRLDSIFVGTIVAAVVRDQVAQFLPTAALVADPLLEAVGILHPIHRLVVLPDDPRLGEFRDNYSGLLGMLTDQPQEAADDQPGFAGSRKVSGSENFLEDLEEGACDRADARGYLKARLMDVFMGDRDRHAGQFRWARFPGGRDCFVWHVVPEDRDQAFVVNDGLMAFMYRVFEPSQTKFGPDYPEIVGPTFTGWELDRRILPELDESIWLDVATEVQAALTDEVIEGAVRRLPASHYELRGEFLESSLKARRAGLVDVARDFYRLISRQVDITATDRDELAILEHLENGDLRVRISYRRGPRSDAPFFDRTFDADLTSEIRLYLQGGDDEVEVVGAKGRVRVRAIGGGGDDRFDNRSDAGAGGTRFYDDRGDNSFEGPARVDRRPYRRPASNNRVHQYGLDWGKTVLALPTAGLNADVGLFLGFTVNLQKFGFRKSPFASNNTFSGGIGSIGPEFRLAWQGLFRDQVFGADLLLEARYSGLDVLRFTGFGNDTNGGGESGASTDFFKVDHELIEVAPSLRWALGSGESDAAREQHARTFQPRMTLGIGPVFKYSNAPADENADQLIGTLDPVPLGVGSFTQLGGRVSFSLDNTDALAYATRGFRLETGASIFPALLDADQAFGEIHGAASAFLTPGSNTMLPTLALRAGGKTVSGSFPFFESAFLGGGRNVRGIRSERFAGESAVYANAELRLPLTRFEVLFPTEIGIHGAVDVGRVFLEGDPAEADRWHTSFGGGLWLSLLNRTQLFSATVVNGDDGMSVYLKAGFHF